MTDLPDPGPLSGPIDDVPDEKKPSKETTSTQDNGSEWIPEPEPAKGDRPLT